jgi:hypothetical protein
VSGQKVPSPILPGIHISHHHLAACMVHVEHFLQTNAQTPMASTLPTCDLCSTTLSVIMGGSMGTYGRVSPTTHHSYWGAQYTVPMGGAQWGGQLRGILPSISGQSVPLASCTPTPIMPPQPDTRSSLATLVVSIFEDSSSDPRVKVYPVLVIKDKPSGLSLKEITDKELWIKAKKIIDTCLRRSPYCPSLTSKTLNTMPEN